MAIQSFPQRGRKANCLFIDCPPVPGCVSAVSGFEFSTQDHLSPALHIWVHTHCCLGCHIFLETASHTPNLSNPFLPPTFSVNTVVTAFQRQVSEFGSKNLMAPNTLAVASLCRARPAFPLLTVVLTANVDLQTGHMTQMFVSKTHLGSEVSSPACAVPIHTKRSSFLFFPKTTVWAPSGL